MYSKVIDKLQPSPIQVMAERTRQAIAAGQSVVDMTLGEPDFPTPAHVCEAAVQAITDGQTRYTPINGTVPLREAILAKFKRENGISCALSEISVGCGGKQVIYQAFLATLNPGDEVAIPTPYWASYADIVSMNGGVLHPIQTTPEQGYALTVEALEEALNNKTKWLVLNSPSNPSGTAYTKEQLLKFAEVIRRCPNKSFFILVDDIYEHILFDGRVFVTLASIAPDLADRILTVNGVSKAYAMTGWRVGYACGPRPLIDAMTKVQMQINSHTSSISQAAATAALNGPQEEIALRRDVFQRRRDYLLEKFSTIDGLYTPKPEGAFYLFPDVRAFIGKKTPEGTRIDSDVVLAGYLLEKGVAIVPGSGFGMPGFMRLSYATSDEKLQMASVRLAGALGALA
ncbi:MULTISPECIES: pyridoxal phosphate-dependent aminotransferase [unclassified Comamonas]|uniref:pyridoxal phosphate-dependent aminotransferase n=1 Tax=unclassified Comamonas TaxID=2638500 RepID=UPI001FA6DC5C|nr:MULTISPECIES: pyridoxal phosphate-dependent aminotransferase [unclassified Comamonas]UNV90746.1 pyridoxal phosphate-dependent aminotransferase [Comamonas sp. 7D-2evo1]UNV95652.1 pyridoxal phosphate-dependent aminotransferase [Comamonas sp. 7D-2]UNW00385.1 pyridoxal phosphate-dependent aminotransferase [Comamonas sp. 7D-2evo2]